MRPMYGPLRFTSLMVFKDFLLFDGVADTEITSKVVDSSIITKHFAACSEAMVWLLG